MREYSCSVLQAMQNLDGLTTLCRTIKTYENLGTTLFGHFRTAFPVPVMPHLPALTHFLPRETLKDYYFLRSMQRSSSQLASFAKLAAAAKAAIAGTGASPSVPSVPSVASTPSALTTSSTSTAAETAATTATASAASSTFTSAATASSSTSPAVVFSSVSPTSALNSASVDGASAAEEELAAAEHVAQSCLPLWRPYQSMAEAIVEKCEKDWGATLHKLEHLVSGKLTLPPLRASLPAHWLTVGSTLEKYVQYTNLPFTFNAIEACAHDVHGKKDSHVGVTLSTAICTFLFSVPYHASLFPTTLAASSKDKAPTLSNMRFDHPVFSSTISQVRMLFSSLAF